MILKPENSPEVGCEAVIAGVDAETLRAAARLYGSAKNASIYYGLGVTEHSQGSTMVMGMANLAMATGNIGRSGVGVNPLRGQNNVQGSCDMGSFPHELPGYRHISGDDVRAALRKALGRYARRRAGLPYSEHVRRCDRRRIQGHVYPGRGSCPVGPRTRCMWKPRWANMECIVVQDLFLNETAKFAHVFLPGTSFLEKERHVHQCRAPHQSCSPGDARTPG